MSDLNIKSPVSVNPSLGQTNPAGSVNGKDKGGESFSSTLEGQISGLDKSTTKADVANVKASPDMVMPATLKFSNHAVERMSQRGITFSPDQMTKIENGARMASKKGAKEALILSEDSALIVDLKENKIVTVMDKNAMKENVFTKIDATVMV